MTEREKIAQIIAEHLCPQGRAHKTLYGAERMCYSRNNFADCEKVSECVDALIGAGYGDVTEWKERAEKAEKERDKEFSVKIDSEWCAVVKSRDIDELVKEVCGE